MPGTGKMYCWWAALVSCMWLLPSVRSDIFVYKRITHEDIAQFDDAPSKFGPNPPTGSDLRGLVVYSSPELACSPVDTPPNAPYNYGNWILLIKRGNCSFEEKVRNAQAAGYTAAIVHNVNSSDLEPMGPDYVPDITIPSVFIGSEDAEMIKRRYMANSTYYVVIIDSPSDIIVNMLLIFSVLVGLCFLGMVVFIVIKFFRDRRVQRRRRLPNSSLKRIPIHKFKTNDPFDTCVICLEDYVQGDKLRVLPCMHAYHLKCIDPWLTNNRSVCPVCKRKVRVGNQTGSDVDSDSDEEQPLLSAASTSGGLFASRNPQARPTESAFQRVRRNFLGLTESIASSISSTQQVSSDEAEAITNADDEDDDFHSVNTDTGDEDRTSLLDEPSVNA